MQYFLHKYGIVLCSHVHCHIYMCKLHTSVTQRSCVPCDLKAARSPRTRASGCVYGMSSASSTQFHTVCEPHYAQRQCNGRHEPRTFFTKVRGISNCRVNVSRDTSMSGTLAPIQHHPCAHSVFKFTSQIIPS